jgi:hypothetical protein
MALLPGMAPFRFESRGCHHQQGHDRYSAPRCRPHNGIAGTTAGTECHWDRGRLARTGTSRLRGSEVEAL